MYHLVIDLEMCNVPKLYRTRDYRYIHEIIEIGAVLLDEQFETIAQLRQYVHPDHGVLDPYIINLTGICPENLKHAPRLAEALAHLADWIGNRACRIYAWSTTDYTQLKREIEAKELASPQIDRLMDPEIWIDYQEVFDRRFSMQSPTGLKHALDLADIMIDGQEHDGLCDAINTAKLVRTLELDKDFRLQALDAYLEEADPLSFSLGGLLAGIRLEQ